MKRLIILLLTVLLLYGCSSEQPPVQTTGPVQEPTQPPVPTEPAGFYMSGSGPEAASQGAIRMYMPEDESTYAIAVVSGDLLVFSGEENTILTRLTGDNLYPIAQIQLACRISPEDPSFQFSDKGITYYDGGTNSLVFLDNDLKEVSRIKTPEGILGQPVLSANRLKLYYCTADALRVWDLETGLDRLLKQIEYPYQTVERILFHDTVLQCRISDEGSYTIFVSTQTGELLGFPQSDMQIDEYGGSFCAQISSGLVSDILYGTSREDVQMLLPADPFGEVWPQMVSNAVIMSYVRDTAAAVEYYDMETGMRTALVDLSAAFTPWYVEEAAGQSLVYILGYDAEIQKPVIYRWDLVRTSVRDNMVYAGPWYTLENPDLIGLEACRLQASAMEEKYGINILIGMDAVAVQPWDYEMEPEYQVPVIQRELNRLAKCLEIYPDGFFQTMDEDITVCLVRGLTGRAESGSLDAANGIQFWDSGKAYVALAVGDMMEMTLYHEMFHVIDNYILSTSYAYYDWERLNPREFSYSLSYTYTPKWDASYLEDDSRVFIDAYSMSYPKEDRARIMEYAATAGNESFFRSETMQKKLTVLCEGIRTAFKLRQYPEPFIWEKYLLEPMTP